MYRSFCTGTCLVVVAVTTLVCCKKAQQAEPVTADWLLGVWEEEGKSGQTMEFSADRKMIVRMGDKVELVFGTDLDATVQPARLSVSFERTVKGPKVANVPFHGMWLERVSASRMKVAKNRDGSLPAAAGDADLVRYLNRI